MQEFLIEKNLHMLNLCIFYRGTLQIYINVIERKFDKFIVT